MLQLDMKKYYVYAHQNDKYGIFYIGKGCNDRLYKTYNRSTFWKNIANKYGYESIILEECNDENHAYNQEMIWIKKYKDIGQCIANFTLGGDGVKVEKRWWNDKISESMKGKNKRSGKDSFTFKDFADEDLLKQLYVNEKKSTVEIADMLNVSYTTVGNRLRQYGIEVRSGKKIKCLNDGKVFNNISLAAKHYGVFRENIRKVLSGKYKTTGSLTFEYKD